MIRIFKENGEEMTLLSEMSKRIKHVPHRGKRGREMKKEGKIDKKIKKTELEGILAKPHPLQRTLGSQDQTPSSNDSNKVIILMVIITSDTHLLLFTKPIHHLTVVSAYAMFISVSGPLCSQ